MDDRKNIVVIGGGHGTGIILSGLKDSGFHLSAIVSMADDGGSTGKLREELGVSAMGDIRQCLVRTATRQEMAELFSCRFEGGKLDGHSLGNLFLASGELETGSAVKSIGLAKQALGVKADIIPATEDKPHLYMKSENELVKGVYKIATEDFDGREAEFYLQPESTRLSSAAEKALQKADLIIIAPGNFYCSIIPALLVGGMAEAIKDTKAKTVYMSNLVNRRNQTVGYTAEDYLSEIDRLTGGLDIDMVVYNTKTLNPDSLRNGEEPVTVKNPENNKGYVLIGKNLADGEPAQQTGGDKIAEVRSLARHDQQKLAELISEIAGRL